MFIGFLYQIWVIETTVLLFRSQQSWNRSLEMLFEERSYNITLTQSQLNGTERFVADNVATKEDCRILKELVNVGTMLTSIVGNHTNLTKSR